jgi:CBS domain-containing protein
LLFKLRNVAEDMGIDIILVGILPTVRRMDFESGNVTPVPRFIALTNSLSELKGGSYELHIRGTDELIAKHNSPIFESSNTSFQIHLQTAPDEIVRSYNFAQAIAASVLAAATNSPLLLGKRLWKETRIALFQQAIDTRLASYISREKSPRVTFGNGWVKNSILEIFQDDAARYKVLLSADVEEDSLNTLKEGGIPELRALRAFNGTIYRWNRVCYGISDGKPHLRIENRILPSGPTVKDEMANAAFWLGLMNGMGDQYRDITEVMEFDDAKTNFFKAAAAGLDTQFKWANGKVVPADELILQELLPIAEAGLKKARVKKTDAENYLEIIRERVASRKTGSRWILDSFSKLSDEGTKDEALVSITAGIINRQKGGEPVHKWELAGNDEAGSWTGRYRRVEQIMSTDLFTVEEDDLVDLAAGIMTWKHIRHVPVEDKQERLVGLVTSGILLRHYGANLKKGKKQSTVKDIMIKNPVTVTPETLTVDAAAVMHKNKIGCLPVVKDGKLVGIVTEHDFMNVSAHLLRELN